MLTNTDSGLLSDDDDDVAIVAMITTAAIGLLVSARKEEEPKKKKRLWVNEDRITNKESGNTQSLVQELQPGFGGYRNIIKMDEDSFKFILSAIRPDIQKQNTFMRHAIDPEEKLAATLRFLATGENFKELQYSSNLSLSFLAPAVIDVCEAIYKNLKDQFLKFPTTNEEWSEIADEYNVRWQFPHCLGALDTKHIAFRPFRKDAPLFYNSKGYHSIVLLGLADAYAKFIFIDVGCNGGISDDEVLLRSKFMYVLQQSENCLPPEKVIGNSRILPHMFVGDNAFPLSENLMTPYPVTTTDENQKIFNRRLSRARQNIERSFGILSNRFQIFQKRINLHQDKVKIIVQCCCVLHNFLIARSRWYGEETNILNEESTTFQQETECRLNQDNYKSGELVRKELTEYFNNEGAI